MTNLHSGIRLGVAALALAASAVGIAGTSGVDAAGLRNCVDLSGRNAARVGCYENVWANGEEYRMTFAEQSFNGSTPRDLDPFYVVAAQTDAPQGPMATFPHDHVVDAVPAANKGSYSVKLQGFFVLCTGQGLASGACAPDWIAPPGADTLPFADSVDGHALTSTTAIEAAAAAGDVALIDLGPGGVIVGSITRGN